MLSKREREQYNEFIYSLDSSLLIIVTYYISKWAREREAEK